MNKLNKVLLVSLSVFALVACEKNKTEATNQTASSTATAQDQIDKKDIKLGNKFVVTNEMTNKNLKIQAHETSLTGEGKYYYQIEIQNVSDQPITIKTEQISLVDSGGKDNRVKLIDREVNEPIEAKETVTGIVAFDDLGVNKPKYLKFKNEA